MESFLITEAQERLSAILKKTFDVIPFATDDECDQMFLSIASFCRRTQEKRDQKRESKYDTLDIDGLIDLSKSLSNESSNGLKRPRDLSDDVGVGCNGPILEKTQWSFEKAYNIVEIVAFLDDSKQLVVKARPPVAGNKAPSEFIMGIADLKSIDNLGGKQAKKLRQNLCTALEKYCTDNLACPSSRIIDLVRPFQWALTLVETLKKLRQKNE